MSGRNLRRWSLLPFVLVSFLCAAALSQPGREGSGTKPDAAGRPPDGTPNARVAAEQSPPATAPARSADEVLGQMLRPRRPGTERELIVNEPPAEERTSGDGAVRPNAPVLTVMREGTPIVNRVGRLTLGGSRTNSSAQTEFTFEADGQALRDPPLVILPNLKLMAMEDAVRGASRDLRFRVSGVVTEYRGRNYVLLEKVTVVQDVTQQFK